MPDTVSCCWMRGGMGPFVASFVTQSRDTEPHPTDFDETRPLASTKAPMRSFDSFPAGCEPNIIAVSSGSLASLGSYSTDRAFSLDLSMPNPLLHMHLATNATG